MRPLVLLLGILLLSGCESHPIEPPPSRQQILFVSDRDGNREIYAMSADGSDVVRLTNHAASDYQARWSPDGRKIVFVADRDSAVVAGWWQAVPDIYVMNADSSGAARLTRSKLISTEPDWSPDGRKIVFSRKEEVGEKFGIYVMNADGSAAVRITPKETWDDFRPRWSPDGRRIAFLSNRRRPDGYSWWTINVMDADGSNRAEVARPVSDGNMLGFDWSPDGTKIVVSHSGRRSGQDLTIMSVDGDPGFVRLIEDDLYSDADPVWSPDGTEVGFATDREGGFEIYVVKASGGGLKNLTRHPARDFITSWKR